MIIGRGCAAGNTTGCGGQRRLEGSGGVTAAPRRLTSKPGVNGTGAGTEHRPLFERGRREDPDTSVPGEERHNAVTATGHE